MSFLKKIFFYLGLGLLISLFLLSYLAYIDFYFLEQIKKNSILLFPFPGIFIINTFLVFSITLQLRIIRQKLKKKEKFNKENIFLKHTNIIVYNKNKSLKFIYILTRFSYHLVSSVLIIVFYRYILFIIYQISLFVFKNEAVSFKLKNLPFKLLYPIGESFYFSTKHRIIFPWINLTLGFFLVDFFLKKIIKKDIFFQKKEIKLIDKKRLSNSLSLAFLVIALNVFFDSLLRNKIGYSYRFTVDMIHDFYSSMIHFIFNFIYTLPILTILFYCTPSRLRDLKVLIQEIVRKFRKV